MKRVFNQYPIFAFLLPVFFVGHAYVQSADAVLIQTVGWLFIKYCFIQLLLYFIFYYVYRVHHKAGVASFITLAIYLFFGALHDALQMVFDKTFIVRYIFLLPALFVCWTIALYYLRKQHIASAFVRYLNMLFVLLICIDGVALLNIKPHNKVKHFENCSTCQKPDVYFIVVDGYAGASQITHDLKSDNSPFLDSLSRLGFRVLSNSTSNYTRTEFSMASMLNMEYNKLRDLRVTDQTLKYCFGQIKNATVLNAFAAQGYSFVNNSIFDLGDKPSPVKSFFLIRGNDLIESETLLNRAKRDIYLPLLYRYGKQTQYFRNFVFQAHNSDSVLYNNLLTISTKPIDKPKFVYTHFLMSHFPYYYKENGQLNDPKDIVLDNYEHQPLYLGNLKHTNTRLLQLLKTLLNRPSPPVILLVSDHGYRYTENIPYTFSTLAAVYLPTQDYRLYNDSLSNINQFPVLFNTLFNQQLPLLPDRKIRNEQ